MNKVNVPLGIGVSYEVSPKFTMMYMINTLILRNVRLEYTSRMIFTDYLALFSKYLTGTDLKNVLILNNRLRPGTPDPETTARPGGRRGNPLNDDSYFTLNFKIGYAFGRDESSSGRGGNNWGIGGGNRYSDRKLSRMHKTQRTCPKMF